MPTDRKLLSHAFFFHPSNFHPRPPRSNFTVPIFDISVSCMLQYHHWWYRYVYARQRGARRPSPRCRATWMAAHTRIADARKRAPPLMAARTGRGISGGFQAASPLTERSWNQASRTSITQVPPCASGAAFPAAVQSTPSTLEQLAPLRCAGSVAPPITGSACSLWRNHQRIRCMSHGLIIYGLGTRWWRAGWVHVTRRSLTGASRGGEGLPD